MDPDKLGILQREFGGQIRDATLRKSFVVHRRWSSRAQFVAQHTCNRLSERRVICLPITGYAPGERKAVEALVRDRMCGAYPLDLPLEVSVGCRIK